MSAEGTLVPRMLFAAILATGLLAAACGDVDPGEAAGSAGWPSYGFDNANSLNNRAEATLSTDNVADLTEVWRLESAAVTGTPVVVDATVYFADWEGVVHALRTDDGRTVWEQQVTDVPISATVAVTDALVVAGDLGGTLHAVDRDNGEPAWSTSLDGSASLFASPVVVDDVVVIGMTDTELGPEDPGFRAAIVAVDLDDGCERWRLHTDPDGTSGTWIPVWSSVAYDPDRGLLFVGTGDTNQPGNGGPGDPSERAEDELPWTDGLLAIDVATGEDEWFHKVVDQDRQRDLDIGASPNLFTIGGQDVVGAGGKSGDYVAVDRDNGRAIWRTHLTEGSDRGGVMATAAVGTDAIYVASNHGGTITSSIFALDMADGTVLWQQDFDQAILGGSMALANGVLYRATWDLRGSSGTIVALSADTGAVLWEQAVDAPMAGGAAIADGTVYVGHGTGTPGNNLASAPGGLIAYRLP